ncbi:MAG TPA: purine-binding chemotaxis protein CheW [Phycisphaerae bacterium]|nr:purine-binding chemotaxis protein CheW [Phycisphaerae bacterium]
MPEEATITRAQTESKAGKYLTFALADEEYGLEILKVREIIGIMDIAEVPRTPDFVKGVINLRGKVIPVIDLRLKFQMETIEQTEETCIIVVDVDGVEMGIIVDKVSEVLDIAAEEIEEPPSFGANVNTDFILGMGKAQERVTILLDIGKVLSSMEVAELQAATQEDSETENNHQNEKQD